MLKRLIPRVQILGLSTCLLFVSGCTSLNSMTQDRTNDGLSREYDVDYKTLYDLTKHACAVLDFKIEDESFEGKYIVAKNGISYFSWGERIGFYFAEVEPKITRIRILSKAKIQTHVLAPKWSDDLHLTIRQRLDQLRAEGVIAS